MARKAVKVGIIGCGAISAAYLKNGKGFRDIEIVAVADLDMKRAKERAAEFEIKKACTVKQLLADKKIEIVINLTIPKAHASVAMQALEAGKSVYNEKPLAVERKEAAQMLALAKKSAVRRIHFWVVGIRPVAS